MKALIVRAIEREVNGYAGSEPASPKRVKVPLVSLGSGRTLDLDGFDFDDLLA